MLKLCRVTKVRIFLLVLGYVYKFDLFEFSAAILEKGLLLQVKKNLVCVNRGRIIGHGVNKIFFWVVITLIYVGFLCRIVQFGRVEREYR